MTHPHHDFHSHFHPTPAQVDDLIDRARRHELGLEFLKNGALDAVAATFGVHAFTVDVARKKLRQAGE